MVTRSKGCCCVASAAYIAGEKIKNERDGKIHDYRNKHEVVHKEILLPANAPPDFRDRAKLWNAAEIAEKRKKLLQSRGVPCEFMFYNEGKCELFIPNAEKDRALALLTSYKKTHSEKGFETQKPMNNKPKR